MEDTGGNKRTDKVYKPSRDKGNLQVLKGSSVIAVIYSSLLCVLEKLRTYIPCNLSIHVLARSNILISESHI